MFFEYHVELIDVELPVVERPAVAGVGVLPVLRVALVEQPELLVERLAERL